MAKFVTTLIMYHVPWILRYSLQRVRVLYRLLGSAYPKVSQLHILESPTRREVCEASTDEATLHLRAETALPILCNDLAHALPGQALSERQVRSCTAKECLSVSSMIVVDRSRDYDTKGAGSHF
jgi:hypothetical protein